MPMTLQVAWESRLKLWAEGAKLRAEGAKLWAEGDKLRAEGAKLWAEGDKLWAEGNLIWINAVLEIHGNIQIEWTENGCRFGTGEEFTNG